MPRTPDRAPGISDEEATHYERTTQGSPPVGTVYFDDASGRFQLVDDVGAYDPRTTGGSGGGGIPNFNSPILTSQNISGGPVDGSGGGYTISAAEAGDWIVWWEGWYSSSANSQLEVGIAINNPAAPIADSLRRSEVDSGSDPLNFQSTAFVSVVANDVIFGTASESGSGTCDLQTRRLFGIKVG